ncbi:hypothetical protein CC78DRAFT_615299 [Lojkania enalia]|uniref:Flavin reductase like domain-containing protein n=1 Tax=Lojkania enalia TaxID=147567 RepID=A0A9P4KCQ3_9PLEO|nr:hypothetical protein CC78DRAFT_615299 [Didymosphaeria enalia]
MVLSQRPATRFFAAFYNWHRYTQRNKSGCRIRPQHPRHLSKGRRLYIQNDPQLRRKPMSEQPLQPEGSDKVKTSTHRSTRNELAKPEELSHWPDDHVVIGEYTPNPYMGDQEQIDGITSGQGEEERRSGQSLSPSYWTVNNVSEQNPDTLRDTVRGLMRNVPQSITVVTATHIDPELKKPVSLGLVVSSFSTVTLNPPTISLNIRQPSQTLDAIRADKGRFRVHFLRAHHEGARLANMFTGGNTPSAYLERSKGAKGIISHAQKDADLAKFALNDHVIAALDCEINQELTVSDHIIVVARVFNGTYRECLQPVLQYLNQGFAGTPQKYIINDQPTIANVAPASPTFSIQSSSDKSKSPQSPFSFSLFPGEQERQTLVNRIERYIRQMPQPLNMSIDDAEQMIVKNLAIPDDILGISIRQIVANVGMNSIIDPEDRDLPIKFDFYGNLAPDDISTIAERLRQLVQEDRRPLSFHFKKLYRWLGVHPASQGMLASDLVNPLRAAGLVQPFEPNVDLQLFRTEQPLSLEYLERIEHRVREDFMRNRHAADVSCAPTHILSEVVGYNSALLSYVKQIRLRLLNDLAPEYYSRSPITISGHVNQYEARVVVRRVVDSVGGHDGQVTKNKLYRVPHWEVLRRVDVHPMVSGIDTDFLFGKLQYLWGEAEKETRTAQQRKKPDNVTEESETQAKFTYLVDKMMDEVFKSRPNWEELTSAINEFVDACPHRAVAWKPKDIVAALGINPRSMIVNPQTSSLVAFAESDIIPELIRKAIDEKGFVTDEYLKNS